MQADHATHAPADCTVTVVCRRGPIVVHGEAPRL
jgi:hypothetical protein